MLLTSYVAPLISGGKKVETCIQFSIPTHIPSYHPLCSATSKHIHYPPLRHASYIPSNRPFIHPSVMENHIHTYTYTHTHLHIYLETRAKRNFSLVLYCFFVFFFSLFALWLHFWVLALVCFLFLLLQLLFVLFVENNVCCCWWFCLNFFCIYLFSFKIALFC